MFYHSITKFVFIFQSLSGSSGKLSAIFLVGTWFQLCMNRIRLDGTTYKQTVICRQLFTDLHAGFSANGKKEKMHQMIMLVVLFCFQTVQKSYERGQNVCSEVY